MQRTPPVHGSAIVDIFKNLEIKNGFKSFNLNSNDIIK
jgi:hypothetical protein